MKLVTFKIHTEERLGVHIGDEIIDLNSAYALYLKEVEKKELAHRWASALIPPCMKEFLEGGNESLEAANKTLDFLKNKDKKVLGLGGERIFLKKKDVTLCAPILRPGKVYCLAVNFYDHVTELIEDPAERIAEIKRLKSLNIDFPIVFQKQPSLVCGPEDPIIKPRVTGMLDYENELAVVIGKRGKYIPKERAYEYVGGYTILIDVSFRDQRFPTDIPWKAYDRRPNTVKEKGMDNAAPMGPCLVTKDEIPDPYSPPLKIITRVNGETRQDGDLSTMMIKIPRLIEYLSMGTTLEPGDVIATGTVPGVGRAYNTYLNVGDLVECEIPGIGVLKHKVVEDR